MQKTWAKYVFLTAFVVSFGIYYVADMQIKFKQAMGDDGFDVAQRFKYPPHNPKYVSNRTYTSIYTLNNSSSSTNKPTSPQSTSNISSSLNTSPSPTSSRPTSTLSNTSPPSSGSQVSSTASQSSTMVDVRSMDERLLSGLNIPEYLRECIGDYILESVPQVFSSAFKNPCWFNDQNFHCLPYFFVGGMPKSGTTDLMSKINSHPDVLPTTKELQWWTRRRYGKSMGFNLYMDTLVKNVKNKKTMKHLVVGDGSASTLWDNYKFAEMVADGPKCTHSDVLRVVQPKAKIIGIFRNPTDRLYSDYKFFNKKREKSPELFHSRAQESIAIFEGCLQQHEDLRKCTYTYRGLERLNIGMYNVFVRDWLRVFPHQQLYFLRTDEWRDCMSELPKIFNFLNLRTLDNKEIKLICDGRPKNTNYKGQILGPMLNETRTLLDNFYKPYMKDLAVALEDNKFTWNSMTRS